MFTLSKIKSREGLSFKAASLQTSVSVLFCQKKRKEKKTLTVPGSKLVFFKSIIVIRKRKIVTKTARRKYLLPNFGEY